jgi:putative flippase GtrA
MTGRPVRLLKFTVVGLIGIGVQLGVLAALVAATVNYLLATAIAVEMAVLHNFIWHERFTWRDRIGGGCQEVLGRLWRFHLGNGLISLTGNLLLMRLLVGVFTMPVMLANMLTIGVCFVANFLASDRWVFIDSNLTWSAHPSATGCAGQKAHK